MRLIKNTSLIILFLTLNFVEIHSQAIQVEKISIPEGLSNTTVKRLFQDSYGLIWIPTEDGLNLYDGYKLKIYKNIPGNPKSIVDNSVWCVSEDKDRNIWIATEAGVSKYIPSENQFINYETKDMVANTNVSLARINFIYVDSKNNVWASTNSVGIVKYDRKNDKWEQIKVIVTDSTSFYAPSAEGSYPIMEDNSGKVWAGNFGYGLIYYDSDKNVFRQAIINRNPKTPNFTQPGKEITELFFDQNNVLWLTTRSGVYKYYPESAELKAIEEYSDYQLTFFAYYNGITKDKDGNIWVANNFRGLLKFDGISDNYKRIKIEGIGSFTDGRSEILLSDVMLDNTGLLWFGTTLAGLFKYNPDAEPFIHYKNDPKNQNCNISVCCSNESIKQSSYCRP